VEVGWESDSLPIVEWARQKKGAKIWVIGLAKLGRKKAHTTWQTEIYGEN
jgi:hypothetical protein